MKKKNEIKKMKAIVNDELANISKEWTEKKLRKEVQDRFRKGIHHTILMMIGFEKDNWGSTYLKVDHCNSRMSIISEFISKKLKDAIHKEMDKVVKSIKFDDGMKKAIFDEYKNQFKDRLQEEAKNLARKKLDTMMKKMFNFLDEL